MRANDGEACTSTTATLLERLREADLGADEQLALLNVHQFTELAADRAMQLLVPADRRGAYLGARAELATYLRGHFCLTLQLGATHHDARAKRSAR